MTPAWRGVETQYIAASMKLVNDSHEQNLLESMLENHKPPLPFDPPDKHYLLLSPFRYSPPHASRFRRANQPGVWYGSATLEGACHELAYWRHRFLTDSIDLAGEALTTEHTFYQATVWGTAIDLMAAPWRSRSEWWRHPSDYSATHALADAAQAASVQWIRYESVRAPRVPLAAVFTPEALHTSAQEVEASREEWFCQTTAAQVFFRSKRGQGAFLWRPGDGD